jgi:hypothetical protein
MTEDLVTRIRNVFEDTPQIMTWFDEETYVGAEVRAHISGMWDTLKEAADRIEHLERELVEERHSREIAAAKGWEFSDRIKELEFVLSFIANINYGNGPDVNMEHQGWAKRALGEKTDD